MKRSTLYYLTFLLFVYLNCGGSKELTVTQSDIKPLNAPVLAIGDEFIYDISYSFSPYANFRSTMKKRIMETVVVKEIFRVSKKTSLDDKEVFLIEAECYNKDNKKTLDYLIYIDSENGKIVRNTFAESARLQSFRTGYKNILGFYNEWMLELRPGYSFTTTSKQRVPSRDRNAQPEFVDAEQKYTVKRIKNFNGRNCFEIDSEYKFPIRKQAGDVVFDVMKYKYYVDVGKRVLVNQKIEHDVTREKFIQ